MMGVPIDGPKIVFGDNMSVINGTSMPQLNVSKKHLGICYHYAREASADGIRKLGSVKRTQEIASCLTNIISGMAKEK